MHKSRLSSPQRTPFMRKKISFKYLCIDIPIAAQTTSTDLGHCFKNKKAWQDIQISIDSCMLFLSFIDMTVQPHFYLSIEN